MPGRQLIMTFPVTATSHALADYRARGGYAALAKALAMPPQDVTKEVTASGLLGHGGAAFPVGRKWQVVKLDDRQPHYLCANADEGEPCASRVPRRSAWWLGWQLPVKPPAQSSSLKSWHRRATAP